MTVKRGSKGGAAMRAAIIDDLATCRKEIRSCLYRYLEENYAGETPIIQEFESGEDFLSREPKDTWDIIFIDQYMEGLSGIKTAEKIRGWDKFVTLVFVTTSLDHAIESFSVRASGYLVKPYSYHQFEKMMELARLDKIRSARFISVEKNKVLLREILWCGQNGHYVEVHTDKRGVFRFRLPFGEFTKRLTPYPQFLTCYKGCIVNMERAERIDALDFVMDTGEKVPFSGRDRKKIETLFDEYMFQREREDSLEK